MIDVNKIMELMRKDMLHEASTNMLNTDLHTDGILLLSRIKALEKSIIAGILTVTEQTIEYNKIRHAILIALQSLAPILPATGEEVFNSKVTLELARQQYAGKNYSEAHRLFTEVLKYNDKSIDALFGLGLIYQALNNMAVSEKYYHAILDLDPEQVSTLTNLGIINQLTDVNKARDFFQRAFKANPAVFISLENLTATYRQPQDYVGLQEKLDELIGIYPKHAELYFQRGMFFEYDLGKMELALSDYNQALELNPLNSNYYYYRSYLYYRSGETQLALDDISRAIRIRPSAAYYGYRGSVYNDTKDFRRALDDYSEGLKLDPNNEVMRIFRASIFNMLRRFNEAIADLSHVLQANPFNDEALWEIARVHHFREELPEAFDFLNRAITLFPDQIKFYDFRAYLHEKSGDINAALIDIERCMTLQVRSPDVTYTYEALVKRKIKLNTERDHHAIALVDLEHAIQKRPRYSPFYGLKGLCLMKTGRMDEALTALNHALELDTHNCDALLFLSELYSEKKKSDLALKYARLARDCSERQLGETMAKKRQS